MGRHEQESEARSVALKKRKRWRRPTLRFLRPFGAGRQWSAPTPSEDSEASEDEVRHHWGLVLEKLLEEKAKTLGSMIDDMTPFRVLSLRKEATGGEAPVRQIFSTTSSVDSASTIHRALERNDSSFLEREEIQSLKLASHFPRGLGDRTSGMQAKRVESETNVNLQQPMPARPALQLPRESMGMSFMMESPMTESSSPSTISMYPLLPVPLISYDELTVGHELGRGQFASVKLSTWNGVKVALKEWHTLTDKESMDMARQEGSTLACLPHPCVVSFYGLLNHGPSPGLVVEYLPHRSLKTKLMELRETDLNNKRLKVAVALRAAQGMAFLHNRKVIHFDLKCDNLLCDLRDLDNPIVKIGDVGLSKEKMMTFVSGNMRGTLPWMAPELFPSIDRAGSQATATCYVNEKVDVYSFGVVLWEIWEMGEMPYPHLDPNQLLEGILQGTLTLDRPKDCDRIWSDIMYQCLSRIPNHRPDFPTIIAELEKMIDDDDDDISMGY